MSSDLFKLISESGWAFAGFLLLLLAPVLTKIVQETLRARVQLREIEARNERQRIARASDIAGISLNTQSDSASLVVDKSFGILERYYNQTLAENRLLSRAAIAVAVLGFFVILIGVGLAFSGFTTVGVVSSVAGLLAEAATIMFFNQLREQTKQVQDYHKKLVSTQYLMTSVALTRELNGNRHDAEIIRIISNLLFLSNELHGSKSDHLFDRAGLLVDDTDRGGRDRNREFGVPKNSDGEGPPDLARNDLIVKEQPVVDGQAVSPEPEPGLVQNS